MEDATAGPGHRAVVALEVLAEAGICLLVNNVVGVVAEVEEAEEEVVVVETAERGMGVEIVVVDTREENEWINCILV